MDYIIDTNDKESSIELNDILALMKKFDEFGHEALSIDELYKLIIGLFEIILSKENQTRQSKERAIKMLANSLGHGVEFTELDEKPKVSPKYRNPHNYKETWTGRGLKPSWVQDHLNSGGKKEELKIS